jgi:hypothetical protein
MLDPWESLKVNERRQLLGAEDGRNGTGTAQLDLYDISSDCRFPQLLSSVITGTAANGDAAALPPVKISPVTKAGFRLMGSLGIAATAGRSRSTPQPILPTRLIQS